MPTLAPMPDVPTLGPRPVAALASARVFRLVVGVIVAAAALKLAQPVLVPLVGGVFLAVLARPLQRRVARALPGRLRWLGLVAAMLAVLGGVAAFGGALYLTGRAVAGELRERRPRLEATIAQARQRLARGGVPASAVPGGGESTGAPSPAAGGSTGAPAASAGSGGAGGTVRRVAAGTLEALGALLLALAFCALGLAEAGDARRRLVRAVPDRATPTVSPPSTRRSTRSAATPGSRRSRAPSPGRPPRWPRSPSGCRCRGCGGSSPSCSSTCRRSARCCR
jgi:predicted PurR-regulated permease PerM